MSAAAGAAIAAAIANAIKAIGVVVRVEPDDFTNILRRVDKPMLIYNQYGLFSTKHQFLTSYKGFTFYAKTSTQIDLPKTVEVVIAKAFGFLRKSETRLAASQCGKACLTVAEFFMFPGVSPRPPKLILLGEASLTDWAVASQPSA